MRWRIVPALLVALGGLVVRPAGAYGLRDVTIYDNYFAPTPAEAIAGETVTWHWGCNDPPCTAHNATAYAGASFASPTYSENATFQYTLPSTGSIRYRCTIHSKIIGDGQCQGMCASIEPDITKPGLRIFNPKSPATVIGSPATLVFDGDAKDNRAVASMWLRVQPLVGSSYDVPIPCPCPVTGQYFWRATVELQRGWYTVSGFVRDTSSLESRSQESVTLLVL